MMATTARAGYSALQILLHWIVAVLVLFQLIFGESMTTVVDAAEQKTPVSPSDQFLATAHYWVGWSILVLVLLRFIIRLAQGAPKPVGGSLTATMAKAGHWAFYILLIAVPVTGLLAVYVSPDFGDIHSYGKPVFIVLIVVHAVAALVHQFWFKDGTFKRMLVPSHD